MEIRNKKAINKGGVKETGYVTLSDVSVNDILVKKGSKGIFFEMPGENYKKDDEWKRSSYATPTDKESAATILEAVKKAVDEKKYREYTSETDKLLIGFVNLKCDNVSVKVSLTEDGRIITPYRKYEKDGEPKYFNFISLTKEQADEVKKAFSA